MKDFADLLYRALNSANVKHRFELLEDANHCRFVRVDFGETNADDFFAAIS